MVAMSSSVVANLAGGMRLAAAGVDLDGHFSHVLGNCSSHRGKAATKNNE